MLYNQDGSLAKEIPQRFQTEEIRERILKPLIERKDAHLYNHNHGKMFSLQQRFHFPLEQ